VGSYAELRLGSFYIGSDKNEINPLVMTLFRGQDKQVDHVLAHGLEAKRYVNQDAFEPDDTVAIVRYECLAPTVRDRLELLGFTRDVSQAAFDLGIRREKQLLNRMMMDMDSTLLAERREFLECFTLDVWLDGLREIRSRGLRITSPGDEECERYSPLLRYMLCEHGISWYGFPGYDIRHMIRLAVDVCAEQEALVYDLTDLTLGGWYDTEEDLVQHAEYLLTEDFELAQRIIVLTEGPTDKWVIESSLRILYPHLADYFTFMDFEGARVAGGAGALAGIVKAFTGAGIINRVVALFDNDTAGSAALRALSRVTLPDNIVALQYPWLDLAARYPTLGPSGTVEMDVNGMAGSVELYLGSDVLTRTDGTLVPVQWRGFDDGVGQYQGEIMDKPAIHERFREKIALCERDTSLINAHDWRGMRLILGKMRSAFHSVDASARLAFEESVP